MREFARDTGATLYEGGEGICHVLLPENGYAIPGTLIVGSDSHSVTYGALNCIGTGVGSTDISVAFLTGRAWVKVPETIRIELHGRLKSGVGAKDLSLHLIKTLGVSGATYDCIEITGPGLSCLEMDGRFTICNMAIEMGAKCALMPFDNACKKYLEERSLKSVQPVELEDGAQFKQRISIDLEDVVPLVALPHDLTKIVPVSDVRDQRVDIAFVGTCTNSRLSDLEEAATFLRGRRVSPKTRLIVTPGSRSVYLRSLELGYVKTFIEAGAIITPPGCGPCVGTHMGIPADGEVVISTANRNFKGRMGNARASIFVASPKTVIASAVAGKITET